MPLPETLEIHPVDAFDVSYDGAWAIPGSKSLTNRALLLAALARGESTLGGVLFSDDTRRMIEALQTLGFTLDIDEPAGEVRVQGEGGVIPAQEARLMLGNAGTAYRFLTAACALGEGIYELDGVPRMRQRPIAQLVEPLRRLGALVDYLGEEGFPPLRLRNDDLHGGELTMAPTLSSQFISALVQIAPYLPRGLTLHFQGPITSRPYVELTLQLMRHFGVEAQVDRQMTRLHIAPGAYLPMDYQVEPDASGASYFLAAAAIVPGSRCRIAGLSSVSSQGDVGFAKVLQRMGAQLHETPDGITVAAPPQGETLRGLDIDLNAMPDMAQTLAVTALFADGPTVIRNVGNLRVKETDRMVALQNELTKLGAKVTIAGDDLHIEPPADQQLKPATIDTYDDHRMAMSFAVAGLRSPGVVIRDPACVNKTFPRFFEYLERL